MDIERNDCDGMLAYSLIDIGDCFRHNDKIYLKTIAYAVNVKSGQIYDIPDDVLVWKVKAKLIVE